jgi:hypothetical protein
VESLLRQLGDSISLLGAILTAPVTILTAIEFLYVASRRLTQLRSQKPALAPAVRTGTIVLSAPAPPPPKLIGPLDFHPEKYERRQRFGRFAYATMLVLALPALFLSPGSLVVALMAIAWLAMFTSMAFELMFRDRWEGFFEKVVLRAIVLVVGAFLTLLMVLVVAGIGFAIGAVVGFIRHALIHELDTLDLQIIAVIFLGYLWLLQKYMFE